MLSFRERLDHLSHRSVLLHLTARGTDASRPVGSVRSQDMSLTCPKHSTTYHNVRPDTTAFFVASV